MRDAPFSFSFVRERCCENERTIALRDRHGMENVDRRCACK